MRLADFLFKLLHSVRLQKRSFFPNTNLINYFVVYGAKVPALIFRAWAAGGVNILRDVNPSKR